MCAFFRPTRLCWEVIFFLCVGLLQLLLVERLQFLVDWVGVTHFGRFLMRNKKKKNYDEGEDLN